MRFYRGRGFAMLAACVIGLPSTAFPEGIAVDPVTIRTEQAVLLQDALNALVEHQGRWAYTETSTGVGRDGKPLNESSSRYDPSKPYAEQYRPIKIRGKEPTEKQLKESAERGENAAKRRFEEQEKLPPPAEEEKPSVHRADEVHLRINGQKATPLIERATVLTEDETSVTYDVPMRAGADAKAMLDKFELTARVNKTTRQFERATIRQREAIRMKLIAKLSDVLLIIEFSTPDPRYPSVPTTFTSDGRVALFFGKARGAHIERVRTELKHVTPYDERFEVKLGTTRTIDF